MTLYTASHEVLRNQREKRAYVERRSALCLCLNGPDAMREAISIIPISLPI